MNMVLLLEKLQEIERALELDEPLILRQLLGEAQQFALELQHESPEQRRRDSRVAVHP